MDIKLIAQNAIRIELENGKVIYFDPFKLNDDYEYDADIIFVTHSHFDHFSPEDILKVKNNNTKIVVPSDLVKKSIECGFDEEDVLEVVPNSEYEFGGIKFKTIPAYNINKAFHKKEFNWVSYILKLDEDIVYVAGDTDKTYEAMEVKCDIALVPVGGTYTMTAKEATELIENIIPKKFAVPTHYKTIVGSQEDAKEFKKLLEGKVDVKILM